MHVSSQVNQQLANSLKARAATRGADRKEQSLGELVDGNWLPKPALPGRAHASSPHDLTLLASLRAGLPKAALGRLDGGPFTLSQLSPLRITRSGNGDFMLVG